MAHRRTNAAPLSLLALPILLLSACGDGDGGVVAPGAFTEADLVGRYEARVFETSGGSGTTDLLSLGSSIEITLAQDGTTTGGIFIPGGSEDGSDFEETLNGTWNLQASSATVRFQLAADVFLRDVDFTAQRVGGVVELEGEETFGGVTVRVVLLRV